MFYRVLLFLLPLPLIVFIWNSGDVEIGNDAKTLFSLILALLTFGGFMDIFRDDWSEGVDE